MIWNGKWVSGIIRRQVSCRGSVPASSGFLLAGTLILLLAAALRLPALGQVPPGLYHDEAYYGLDAVDVLQGHLQVYFPANNGREPLFIYLAAGMIGLLGRSPFALRLTSAFVGLLTVAATAAAGRALFSRRVGLLAAAVLSVTLWHVHLSRVGFRAVTLPLIIALTLWVGARAARTGRPRLWLAAGALYGLSFYTYTAARFTPVALAAFGLYLLLTPPPAPEVGQRRENLQNPPPERLKEQKENIFHCGGEAAAMKNDLLFRAAGAAWCPDKGAPDQKPNFRSGGETAGGGVRPHLRGLGLALLAAAVVLTPLAIYTALHPDVVLGRPDQVSIWNPAISGGDPWGTLGRHLLRTLGMFFVRGDRIWRHNVPWRPVFGPLLGAAFLLGVGVALTSTHHPPSRMGVGVRAKVLPLLWTAVMALPTVLAEDAPHFLRAVGMLPILAFLPALGLDALMQRLPQRYEDTKKNLPFVSLCLRGSPIGVVVSILAIGLELVSGARAYFGPYAHNPTTGYWFERGAVALGADINRFLGVGWPGEASPFTPTARPAGAVYLDPLVRGDRPQLPAPGLATAVCLLAAGGRERHRPSPPPPGRREWSIWTPCSGRTGPRSGSW